MSDRAPKPGRLLVVDDSQRNIDLMVRRLERAGYVVEAALSGEAALSRIAARGIDLVLLDVMMPGLSGIDVVRRLRLHHRLHELPVIMVTALDEGEAAVEALSRGANDYVTKPVDFPVLLARVATQLKVKRLNDLKDEFIGIATHDLRNPLHKVLGGADLLRSLLRPGDVLEEDHIEVLSGICRGGKEMLTIIQDFLEFGALSDGDLKLRRRPVDLCALVHEVVDTAAPPAARKGIELSTRCEQGLRLSADPDRLRQVLVNLISNAVKFSPPGTRTRVEVVPKGAGLRIAVIDQGPGFSSDDLGRAFERYARLSNAPTGGESSTGLGLSICQRIVELHGGRIGLENNEGPGATLWFWLPLSG